MLVSPSDFIEAVSAPALNMAFKLCASIPIFGGVVPERRRPIGVATASAGCSPRDSDDCLVSDVLVFLLGETNLTEPRRNSVWVLLRRLSALADIAGKPPSELSLGIGVAVGSTDTTERTGKTRSCAVGLRGPEVYSDTEDSAGEGNGSLEPVNMLTDA